MMYYIMRQISRARRRVITPILSYSLHSLTVQTLSSFTVFYFYGEIVNSGGDRFARIESDVVLSHFQIKV